MSPTLLGKKRYRLLLLDAYIMRFSASAFENHPRGSTACSAAAALFDKGAGSSTG
jgi:hypothetical protein